MVVDTNILIACFNAEANAVVALSKWKREQRPLFISSVSFAEVLAMASLTDKEIAVMKAFLQHFILIPMDAVIAERAAYFRRMYRFEIPDAAIAATALTLGVPLVTRDRQFKKLRDIQIISV